MKKMMMIFSVLLGWGQIAYSQLLADSLLQTWKLQDCVQYALLHQPSIQQSSLNEEITERSIQSKLADWYPQLNLNYTIENYPQIPVSIVQGFPAKLNLQNTSGVQFSLTQALFNRDVLLASRSAGDARNRSRQQTLINKIDVVINVSKAFYAVLVTQSQIQVLQEDIVRLEQNLKDAYEQYRGGIVDNIDYKRATILLNNARQEKRQNEELLNFRYAALREQIGYPSQVNLKLEYDGTQMEHEAFLDTNQAVHYENRIEYQLLQTQKRLQEADLSYYKWSFLPSISAFANYSMNYQNNDLARLYDKNYPGSFVGLQLSFPIFQGGKRIQEIKQAELELQLYDYDFFSLKNFINTEFAQALANYKSNLNNYSILKDNLELARDVYRTIQMQYKAGTKTYLEVITAETDLRTAQINYTNTLYQVLSSKLDLQKALGTIQYQ